MCATTPDWSVTRISFRRTAVNGGSTLRPAAVSARNFVNTSRRDSSTRTTSSIHRPNRREGESPPGWVRAGRCSTPPASGSAANDQPGRSLDLGLERSLFPPPLAENRQYPSLARLRDCFRPTRRDPARSAPRGSCERADAESFEEPVVVPVDFDRPASKGTNDHLVTRASEVVFPGIEINARLLAVPNGSTAMGTATTQSPRAVRPLVPSPPAATTRSTSQSRVHSNDDSSDLSTPRRGLPVAGGRRAPQEDPSCPASGF